MPINKVWIVFGFIKSYSKTQCGICCQGNQHLYVVFISPFCLEICTLVRGKRALDGVGGGGTLRLLKYSNFTDTRKAISQRSNRYKLCKCFPSLAVQVNSFNLALSLLAGKLKLKVSTVNNGSTLLWRLWCRPFESSKHKTINQLFIYEHRW